MHVKRNKILDDNNGKLYPLLWEKCTENMKANIKPSTKYQNIDGITLLNDLEQVTLNYEDQHHPYESYVNTHHRFLNVAQGDFANSDYYKNVLRQ